MLAPTSEVETPRAGSTPVAGARVNCALIRGSVLRPRPTFAGHGKQAVNVFRHLDLGDTLAAGRHPVAAVIFSGWNTRMLPPSDVARLGFVRFGGGRAIWTTNTALILTMVWIKPAARPTHPRTCGMRALLPSANSLATQA